MAFFKKKTEPRKRYVPKNKFSVRCDGCLKMFETCRRNQKYCDHPDCQVERKKKNMDDFITRQSKKIERRVYD